MSCRAIQFLLVLGFVQTAFAFEEELRFVKGLTEAGFPNLARTVLHRTLRKFPAAEKTAPELRVRIWIAEKEFEKAREGILALEKPEKLWLFLAETAIATRHLSVAEEAYPNYLEHISEADEATGQAAFNYGELLEERGDYDAAQIVYEKVLQVPNMGKYARPVKAKLAALLLESNLDRSQELCEDVQLGGLDLWFGKAVVTWAQIMTIQEEWEEAQSVLEMQLELLKQLEELLEAQGQPISIVSPLSGARYWLGVCYEHEGRLAEALIQFYNVYVQYGDSEWGPKAQERTRVLTEYFEGQGKTVQVDLGANRVKMQESTFRVARRLFLEKNYAEAMPSLINALNEYPESDESVTALRFLTLSAIHLDDELRAKTIALYLAERFRGNPAAGDALLATGKVALDGKKKKLAGWIYGLYLDAFPTHPRAAGVLYSLASLCKQNDDLSKASAYLNRLIENYPDSTYHVRALGSLAWNAFEAKDYETAAIHFAPYVDIETDSKKQTRALFAFAESYRFSNAWKKSLEIFQALEKSMCDVAGHYGVSDETLLFNQPFHEKSIYYQAICYAQLGETDEAVQTCERFLKSFPESEFVPQVHFIRGKTCFESERFVEALAAFESFGDGTGHKFAESVFYYRGVAQFETGAHEASIQCLEELLMNWPASVWFFDAQFVQGRAYAASGQRDEAIRVFGNMLNGTSDDLRIHRIHLELGRVQTDPSDKLASFQRVALLADPNHEEHAKLIAKALYESLPLYLELARTDDLLADSDRLMKHFPQFGKTAEINAFREQAQQKIEVLKNVDATPPSR